MASRTSKILLIVLGLVAISIAAVLAIKYGRPIAAAAYYEKGVQHVSIDEPHEALDAFTEAIEFDPSHALALFERGNVRLTLGQAIEALEDFEKAIGIDPDEARFYGGRGAAKLKLGRTEDGFLDLDKAAELALE